MRQLRDIRWSGIRLRWSLSTLLILVALAGGVFAFMKYEERRVVTEWEFEQAELEKLLPRSPDLLNDNVFYTLNSVSREWRSIPRRFWQSHIDLKHFDRTTSLVIYAREDLPSLAVFSKLEELYVGFPLTPEELQSLRYCQELRRLDVQVASPPEVLTGPRQCRMSTTIFFRRFLPGGVLHKRLMPLLVHP